MEKVVVYDSWSQRKIKEVFLLNNGWRVLREEEIKEFNAAKGCLLAILFLPLVFFGFSKKIKVTYIKD